MDPARPARSPSGGAAGAAPGSITAVGPVDGAGRWHRLHPLSPVVRAGRSLLALVIPIVLAGGRGADRRALGLELIVVAVVVVLGVISWMVTRWRIEQSVLRIDTGLLRRSSRRFPLGQIQAVDLVEPLLGRIIGLAELRVRVAGSSGTAGRLAYLRTADAERLRGELLHLAAAAGRGGPVPGRPRPADPTVEVARAVVAVHNGRLILSALISGPGLVLCAVLAALAVLAVVDPGAVAVVISAGLTLLLTIAGAAGRRLSAAWDLRVVETGAGYRVRSGLFQTATETVPFGRVQAVRVVEPLAWQALGWCRVEVDVAGAQRSRGENDTVSHSIRAILPVGTHAEADALLARLVPGDAPTRIRPPRRARWKSPLRYHRLSGGTDDRYAVVTSGRLRRATDWVPLAKVQGIRLVEGPLARSLHLGTIHLDTAGRSVHAALRDRDREECAVLMTSLPEQCRRARQGAGAPPS